MLKKTVGNWVDGDRFFDRDEDLSVLCEEICEGTSILLTGQRRMGKTSLVREAFRRLERTRGITTLFVDLEDAKDPADAVVRIVDRARSNANMWQRLKGVLGDGLDRLETVGVGEFKISLRAQINEGTWKYRGDAILDAIARKKDRRVVIALDELPLVVNRILVNDDYAMPRERIERAGEFLSWIRGSCQRHRDQISVILLGSVGFPPILKRAGLSATMNTFSLYRLEPWSEATAVRCLAELARYYEVELPTDVRLAMCRRLRSCVPHHVQQFFDALHRVLRLARRSSATLEDAERAYRRDVLGTRGRIDMDHYEERLKLVLGPGRFRIALELLARAATQGSLGSGAIDSYQSELRAIGEVDDAEIPFVLDVLEHDGYLKNDERGEFRFRSGLLEDWQRARHGMPFRPFARKRTEVEAE